MNNKYLTMLAVLFFSALVPINATLAITQQHIDAEVQIVCPDDYGNWYSGSGTIIDPKGIILTNKHVVSDLYGGIIKSCYIGFIESIHQVPNFGTQANPNLAEVKYYTATTDMDAAVLYLNNSTNQNYPYINIWDSNSDALQFGQKIEAIGFPSIGGSTITYTSGDFSGFGSTLDGTQNYIKATTPLEHGNSGGAAYTDSNEFIGIPTAVIAGELNSISYILSANSIKEWLLSIFGTSPASSLSQQQAEVIQPKKTLQQDVTPPTFHSDSYYVITFHSNDRNVDFHWNLKDDDSDITISWPAAYDAAGVDGYYVYFGTDPKANPVTDGTYIKTTSLRKNLTLAGIYYAKVAPRDINGNIGDAAIGQYNFQVYDNWLINNPMQYQLVTNRPVNFKIYDYSLGNKGDLLKTIKLDSSRIQTIYVPSNNVLIEWDGAQDKNFITKQGIRFSQESSKSQCEEFSNESPYSQCVENENQKNRATTIERADEIHRICGVYSMVSPWSQCNERQYTPVDTNVFTYTKMDTNIAYHFEYIAYFTDESHINATAHYFQPFVLIATRAKQYTASNNTSGVNGYILLQVEAHGEAWYVEPNSSKRYYMKDGTTAYNMMRSFGLGITNADLSKIPSVEDTDAIKNASSICSTNSIANRLKGKILLQVQQHGEAYYVYPKNCRMIYMKDGAAAYQIMRYLGLGITNIDLNKIQEGQLWMQDLLN